MIASDRPRLAQLDQMILGKSVNMLDVSEAHKQSIQPVLEVLKEVEGVSAAQMEGPVSVLSALHLITSALGGEHDFFFFFQHLNIVLGTTRFGAKKVSMVLGYFNITEFENGIVFPECLEFLR